MGKEEKSTKKGKPPRGKKPNLHIPQHEIEALARCLLPEIQKFFESEEGKREFEAWKTSQKDKNEKIK